MACAGVVEDWNAAFLQAVRKETPPPCLVSRNFPLLHLSVFRAAQEAAKAGLDDRAQELAAFHAAETIFQGLFPSQPALLDELRVKYRVATPASGAGPPAPDDRWRTIGEACAHRTLQERENDGSSTTMHYVPNDKPGQWRRTPPRFRPPEFPHWGRVRPFVLDDVARFRAPPPPALDSELYARDLNEVQALGAKNSTVRTGEQTLIARFWADFSYTTSPAGHWNDIARELSLQKKLNLADSARLFVVLNLTMADTCIAIWDTKYHYNYWRPSTAIPRADDDGNSATHADKNWESLLPTPPHPDYVSGHSGISGAASTILEKWFGTEGISFEAASDDVKDVKRGFTSFRECSEEIARSRVYAGIHYSSAGREGLMMGRKIAEFVWLKFED